MNKEMKIRTIRAKIDLFEALKEEIKDRRNKLKCTAPVRNTFFGRCKSHFEKYLNIKIDMWYSRIYKNLNNGIDKFKKELEEIQQV